jgi:hypothetical protein
MPRVKFEPTTPVLERAKTVHALDRAAAAIGMNYYRDGHNCYVQKYKTVQSLFYWLFLKSSFRLHILTPRLL